MTVTVTPTCGVITEAGTCNNNIDHAIDLALAAYGSGAAAFKVQMLDPETITSRQARRYDRGLTGVRQFQYDGFTGALSHREWRPVKQACDDLGLPFFASVWDYRAVDECVDMGVDRIKIGSGDITFEGLLRYTAATGLPVYLSTGGATVLEIDRALEWLDPVDVTLFVCTLAYPCPAAEAHLARIPVMRDKYRLPVGYSDHTMSAVTVPSAAAAGARWVEKHFTLTPGQGGDHDFALDPDGLRWAAAAVGTNLDPTVWDEWGDPQVGLRPVEAQARVGARRSVHTARPVEQGRRFTWEDLVMLRPGSGIPPAGAWQLIGLPAGRPYAAGEQVEPAELF